MDGKVLSMRGGVLFPDSTASARIDRFTSWGNPFRIGRDGSRAEVIEKYRAWLWNEIKAERVSLEALAGLYGKDLYCWCAPRACHGDVLIRAARWARSELGDK